MGLMETVSHQLDTEGELLEVALLDGSKRMLPKERNDPFEQILSTTNDVAMKVLPVVVMPPVDVHLPHSKELPEVVEAHDARGALRHHEVVGDLVSGCVAGSARSAWLPNETDREASFSVYETDHPATELDQSFLLIFRTRHVVTVGITSDVHE